MKKKITLIIDFLVITLLVYLDQLTKSLAISTLKDQAAVVFIPHVLEFRYLENRGAAFGMLQNQKFLFIIIAAVMLIAITYVLIKLPQGKKYAIWQIFLCLISAGGIGNMIDRVTNNYVVDFLNFLFIEFPIFNVADIYVTIGTILLFLDILFLKKEEDLEFLKWEKTKK